MTPTEIRDERAAINSHNRRMREEAAALRRLDRQMDAAEALIGELHTVDGKVHYINLRDRKGNPTGKIMKGRRLDLIDYLIRNRYV